MLSATKPYAFRRWQEGVCCPKSNCAEVLKRGKEETQPQRQRYHCKGGGAHFDHLSDTVFAGHHQPLRVWILCLYFIGLNLSKRQIAQELELDEDDVDQMRGQLRQGIIDCLARSSVIGAGRVRARSM